MDELEQVQAELVSLRGFFDAMTDQRDRLREELDSVLRHDKEAVQQLNAAEAELVKAQRQRDNYKTAWEATKRDWPLMYHVHLKINNKDDQPLAKQVSGEPVFKMPTLPFPGLVFCGVYEDYTVVRVEMDGLRRDSNQDWIYVTVKVEVRD